MAEAPKPFREEEVSYLGELLGHPLNLSGFLTAITAGAILSVGFGLAPAAIPILLYVGGQAIIGLFVPSSPIFREYVNRKKRAEYREGMRAHLQEQIGQRIKRLQLEDWEDLARYQQRYTQMRDRLSQLLRLASNGSSGLSTSDLERLDDATVDYLRLVYRRILLHERLHAEDARSIEQQLADIQYQLHQDHSGVDRKRLEQAHSDLTRMLERRAGLPAKDAATAAQLITMSEAFEEIYHRVTTDPTSEGVGEFLREATERLTIEEELAMSVDEELDQLSRRKASIRLLQ